MHRIRIAVTGVRFSPGPPEEIWHLQILYRQQILLKQRLFAAYYQASFFKITKFLTAADHLSAGMSRLGFKPGDFQAMFALNLCEDQGFGVLALAEKIEGWLDRPKYQELTDDFIEVTQAGVGKNISVGTMETENDHWSINLPYKAIQLG